MKKIINLKDVCYVSSNYSNDNYVGIKFSDDGVRVYFPMGYEIPSDNSECRRSIIELLKTISIERIINKGDSKYSLNNGKDREVPINSFLWIINDYLNNGLYSDKEKIYVRGKNGKINWKRTLNTKFYVSNNSAIYLDPYVEKNTLEDNIITDIHAYCVSVSIDYIGWIFGKIPRPNNNIRVDKLGYYISVLNKELLHSFDDKKKALLMNMKKVLEMCGGEYKTKLKDIGTNNYEFIWEYMVNSVYGNLDPKMYFPNSKYNLIGFEDEIESSSLRPDTVLEVGEDLYILDSKYYKYGITRNPSDLPSTDSIQKQITYGDHAKNSIKKHKKIFNAFIIPYNKSNNKFDLEKNIEYVGFAKSSWRNTNELHDHISVILIDTKFLIDCYNRLVDNETSKLLSSIQKIIDTFE